MVQVAPTVSVVHNAQKLLYISVFGPFTVKHRKITMDPLVVIDLNTKLAAVYYNKGKPTLLRIRVDVTLSGLKDQLNQINRDLHYREIRSVDSIEYRRPSTGSDGSIEYTQMKLKNDDDVRTMFSIFEQYSTKGPIELDALLIRSFEDIRKSLIRPRTYEEIRELMDGPEDVISLADP